MKDKAEAIRLVGWPNVVVFFFFMKDMKTFQILPLSFSFKLVKVYAVPHCTHPLSSSSVTLSLT